MKQPALIRGFLAIGFITMIVCSIISSQTGQIDSEPKQAEPLFTPHPFAFSIWFLIYLGLFLLIIRSFFRQKKNDKDATDGIGGWLALAMIFSGVSIVIPEQASIFFIAGALLMLMGAYTRMKNEHEPSLYVTWPVSMFIAWISVATIVDAFVVMRSIGAESLLGLNEGGWTFIMLAVSILLANLFMYKQNDLIFGGVFVWAYIMLIFEHPSVWIVTVPSAVGVVAVLITAAAVIRRRRANSVYSPA